MTKKVKRKSKKSVKAPVWVIGFERDVIAALKAELAEFKNELVSTLRYRQSVLDIGDRAADTALRRVLNEVAGHEAKVVRKALIRGQKSAGLNGAPYD